MPIVKLASENCHRVGDIGLKKSSPSKNNGSLFEEARA